MLWGVGSVEGNTIAEVLLADVYAVVLDVDTLLYGVVQTLPGTALVTLERD